jgi:DME family drug/metabolite transporter
VLLYTAPAWVALLARIALGERLTARRLLAVALTLAGVALVATAGGGPLRVGGAAVAWGLLSGASYALYYLFGRRYFARHPAPVVFAVALPVGALGLLPFVRVHEKTLAAWAAILFVAVVPTYLAYLAYAAGLRRVEATRAATAATVEPVVAAVAAFVAFGERLAPLAYLGGAVVLAGVLLTATAGADAAAGAPSREAVSG